MNIRTTVILLALVCLAPSLMAQTEGVAITGECSYNTDAATTICTYHVTSMLLSPVQVYFPVPENCGDSVEVTSPCLEFEGPAVFCSQTCGDMFGFRSSAIMVYGQAMVFTVIYHGVDESGMGPVTVSAAAGGFCLSSEVPGVTACFERPYCNWLVDATGADFIVRKPGDFAGSWADVTIESNIDLSLQFSGFEELLPDGLAAISNLPVWHALNDFGNPNLPEVWLTPTQFSELNVNINGDDSLTQFSIWTRVQVADAATSGDYQDEGVITIVLENNKTWIDGENFRSGRREQLGGGRRAGGMVLK